MNDTLRQFAATGDEAAFKELVDRHGGLVYGIALRRTGDAEMAREITQNVFVILARKARSLARPNIGTGLGPWLHRTTIFETANRLRKEATRKRTMHEYTTRSRIEAEGIALWEKAAPVLDGALDQLPDADRQVLLLRFFEDMSFREIGRTLGKTEDAVQKRSSRALGRLSRLLRRKGVAIPATVIAPGLGAQLSQAAPAELAGAVSSAAVSQAAQGGAAGLTTGILLNFMNAKLPIAATVLVVALAIPIVSQQRTIARLDCEVAALESKHHSLKQAAALPAEPTADGSAASSTFLGTPARIGDSADEPVTNPDLDALLENLITAIDRIDLSRMMSAMTRIAALDRAQVESILVLLDKKHLPEHVSNQVAEMLLDGLADDHSFFVLAYALERRTHFSQASDALRVWAEKDFDAARAWFEEQRDRGALDSKKLNEDAEALLEGGLIAAAAKDDLDFAVEMLNDAPGKASRTALEKIVQRFLIEDSADPERVLALAGRLQNDDDRAYTLTRYAVTLSGFTSFDNAAAFADTLDLPPEPMNEIRTGIASLNGNGREHERMDWLISVSAPDFVNENVKDFLFNWITLNPAGAVEWTEAQAGTPHFDAAVEGVAVGLLARQHPVDALEWTSRIGDDGQRTRVAERIQKMAGNTPGLEVEFRSTEIQGTP